MTEVFTMWPTSRGDRTLDGNEAALIASAIAAMLDPIVDQIADGCGDDDDAADDAGSLHAALHTGVSVYDSLNLGQRLAILHRTALHLLTPAEFPDRQIAAVDEATIAVIFNEVRDWVEMESDCLSADDPQQTSEDRYLMTRWRCSVLAACQEVLGPGEWDAFAEEALLTSVPMDQWEEWIDYLASAILWDRDFEFVDSFLDADPDSARIRRQALGIDDDYFVCPAPDPNPAQIDRLVADIRLTLRPFGVYWGGDRQPTGDEPF